MKPIRNIALLILFLPLNVHAEVFFSGQLQQELVSWNNPEPAEDAYEVYDGGQLQQASHDADGASYIALLSNFYLTPNHQGIASFQFDLNQDEGVEHQEVYLGIKNPTSSWRMGTIASPYKESTAGWDPFLATFMQARGNGGASLYHNGYIEGAINYQSDWWSDDVALQWSPDQGNSYSISQKLTHWEWSLSTINDAQAATHSRASKLGLRHHDDEWVSTFVYESLKNDPTTAQVGYINLTKQSGKTEYGFSVGGYRSDDETETDLDYYVFGVKHALAKNNILHFGYRLSSAPDDGSKTEKGVGLGFRYSF